MFGGKKVAKIGLYCVFEREKRREKSKLIVILCNNDGVQMCKKYKILHFVSRRVIVQMKG